MQHLEVSCAVRRFFKSLGFKGLDNLPDALIIQILSVIKSTCFGQHLCPSSGVLCCTFGTDKFHAGF